MTDLVPTAQPVDSYSCYKIKQKMSQYIVAKEKISYLEAFL